MAWIFPLAALLFTSPPAMASEQALWSGIDFHGDIETEMRIFPNKPRWPGQPDDNGFSLAVNLDFRWHGEQQRIGVRPFLRWDSVDQHRSHFDLREAYWAWEGDNWELLAGFNKVFWGVTESRHLVDVINQTDLVEDPDQEQKLGQPMLNVTLMRDWGDLDLYVMPWFRERTFPGVEGRLRPPLPVDTERAVFESSAEEWHTDIAARWSHYFGDVDIGLSAFHGTGREPKLIPSSQGKRLLPHYHQITQLGMELQYTNEAWLWKMEAIVRNGREDTFAAAVSGFEYTLFGVAESEKDLGLIVEYLYDGRGSTEPVTVFDDDLFLGTRLSFNDSQDTSLLAGMVIDRKERDWFFSLEAERRLGENYLLQGKVRVFKASRPGDPLFAYDRDDYLQLSLKRYF